MHRFRVWVGIVLSCRLNPKIGALRVWAKLGDTENVLRPNLHTNLFAFWCNPTGSQSWTLALGQKMKTFESDLYHIDFWQCYRKSETSSHCRLGRRTIKRPNLTLPMQVHRFLVWVGTVLRCRLTPNVRCTASLSKVRWYGKCSTAQPTHETVLHSFVSQSRVLALVQNIKKLWFRLIMHWLPIMLQKKRN